MDWKPADKNDKGLYKIPKRWLHVHYYEALTILFRFENSLRVFVYAVLKNSMYESWKDCGFTSAGEESKTIKGIASKRIHQAENFGYLGFNVASPVMHLTSGELIDVLTADAHWPKFRGYFRGNREIIKNKLLEIGAVRNAIAHFRPIKAEDVELVKQNSRHVLLGVEECLSSLFSQNVRVPTNTSAAWYDSISALGTSQVSISPHLSKDESWLCVKLSFAAPQLSKVHYGDDFFSYSVCNLNTPNLLRGHDFLASRVTYISEYVPTAQMTEEYDLKVTKSVNLVFLKAIFEADHEKIAIDLKAMLMKINEECELLLQDNLAKGDLVESASCYSMLQKEGNQTPKWNHTVDAMWKQYESHHPDEYWGKHQFVSDVVGGCKRYPWMPTDISEQEGFMD